MERVRETSTRRSGFTLIEILAVVVIIGFLLAIVAVNVAGRIDVARATTAKTQIMNIETALEFYRSDNGRYPTTEQGLDALVHEPSVDPLPRMYPPGGYLKGSKVPVDPWGVPFEYEAPGRQNPNGVDSWTLGADGKPGGEDVNADLGNWTADSGN
jgi:general secretion pathway protein G